MNTLSLDLILDLLVIMISAVAVLYCATLNSRIRKLNSLESGLGATIVTLTKTIEDTHQAAKEAQQSTLSTVSRLKELIHEAEEATPKVDALIVELNRTRSKAEKECTDKLKDIESTIRPTIDEAVKTSQNLLEIITMLEAYQNKLGKKTSNIVTMRSASDRKVG